MSAIFLMQSCSSNFWKSPWPQDQNRTFTSNPTARNTQPEHFNPAHSKLLGFLLNLPCPGLGAKKSIAFHDIPRSGPVGQFGSSEEKRFSTFALQTAVSPFDRGITLPAANMTKASLSKLSFCATLTCSFLTIPQPFLHQDLCNRLQETLD